MEIRRSTICLAVFVLAVVSHCSDAHTLRRRGADDVNYDDEGLQQDQANDYDAQKDAEGGNDADEDEEVNGVIVTKPNRYYVDLGQTVRLECNVSPAEGTVVAWYKDGEQYFLGPSKTIVSDRFSIASNSKDLLIKDLVESDVGRYKCTILQHNSDSIEHTVVLNGAIVTKPEQYQVNVGQTVRLECRVTLAAGTAVIWHKDGQQIHPSSSPRYSIVDNSNDLLIRDLVASDSGRYKCELVQAKPASIEHTIMVLESPRILKFEATQNGNLVEGQDLLLTCDVVGSPKPEIIWSRTLSNGDNEKLSEKHGEFHGNTFFAKNVRPDISGKYLCYAINTVGSNTAELTVTVSGKPRVHVPKTIVNTDVNIEALLQCSAHEHPQPHIRWYKDGNLIQESSSQFHITTRGAHSNLTVTPQSEQDFGVFTCEAENNHGKHDRSIDLVQSPVIESFDVDGPKLTWTVNSHQPLEQMELQLRSLGGDEWKKIDVPVLPATEGKHQYEIIYVIEDKNLEAGKYEATVKVKNNKSWSTHSDPTIIEIEAQAQPIQTATLYRGNNSAHSIRPASTALLSTILMYLLVRML